MPLGPQPRRADGTIKHPYSALRLRLALALFGLVVCVVGGILIWQVGPVPIAVGLFVLAAVALIDLVVIIARLRAAR